MLWLEISRIVMVTSGLLISYFCNLSAGATVLVYSLGLTVQYILSILLVLHVLRTEVVGRNSVWRR